MHTSNADFSQNETSRGKAFTTTLNYSIQVWNVNQIDPSNESFFSLDNSFINNMIWTVKWEIKVRIWMAKFLERVKLWMARVCGVVVLVTIISHDALIRLCTRPVPMISFHKWIKENLLHCLELLREWSKREYWKEYNELKGDGNTHVWDESSSPLPTVIIELTSTISASATFSSAD